MSDYTCSACGKPCHVVIEDVGIGHYEYWGAKCVDKQMAAMSDCCEADLNEDFDVAAEMEDLACEAAEARADDDRYESHSARWDYYT